MDEVSRNGVSMDAVRYEILWLIGTFSVGLLALEADEKVTRVGIGTFAIYAGVILIRKISDWFAKPDAPLSE